MKTKGVAIRLRNATFWGGMSTRAQVKKRMDAARNNPISAYSPRSAFFGFRIPLSIPITAIAITGREINALRKLRVSGGTEVPMADIETVITPKQLAQAIAAVIPRMCFGYPLAV